MVFIVITRNTVLIKGPAHTFHKPWFEPFTKIRQLCICWGQVLSVQSSKSVGSWVMDNIQRWNFMEVARFLQRHFHRRIFQDILQTIKLIACISAMKLLFRSRQTAVDMDVWIINLNLKYYGTIKL